MYKTILVPIDIEEDLLTEHALKHVEYLAKMSGAKVHFFHALPDASALLLPIRSVSRNLRIRLK